MFSAHASLCCGDHADFRAAVQACLDTLPAGGAGVPAEPLAGREITRRALVACDAVCVEIPDLFCALLGTAAANLAVTLGARGGIYIGGAIVKRLGACFDHSPLRARFEDRGRFSRYVSAIPTVVITAGQSTFIGASAILDSQLRALQDGPGSATLAPIRRACSARSPAELRVDEQVLTHPRAMLNQPIIEIARTASPLART